MKYFILGLLVLAAFLVMMARISFAVDDEATPPSRQKVSAAQNVSNVDLIDHQQAADARSKASSLAGEQINWQVVSSGGSLNSRSTDYKLSNTVGQTATAKGSSDNYGINHGFWQDFEGSCCYVPGDANNDENCNIGDQVYLINYIFRPDQCATNPPIGCPPDCLDSGDANFDCSVNIGDAIVIGNFVFNPGAFPDPECGCVE